MEKRGLIGLMILAIFAMTIGSTASATASPPGGAGVAKKKCKRADGARKKCKRQRKRRADDPQLPVIRATLTWFDGGTNDMDVSLFVFDGEGNRAGSGSNGIPLSSLSGDVTGAAGSESFTDGLFTPHAARNLSFGVCLTGPGADQTNFTLIYVTADGVIHGDTQSPATSSHYDYPGGAPIPTGYCAR